PLQCEHLVEQVTGQQFEVTPQRLLPTPPGFIVQRMLANLKKIYMDASNFQKAVRIIERLLQLKPNDAGEHRDLGTCLIGAGRHGAAIDHLSAYFASTSANGEDQVRFLLNQAQAEVARWN